MTMQCFLTILETNKYVVQRLNLDDLDEYVDGVGPHINF